MRPLVSALETLVGEELLLPVNLASRLVLSSTAYAQQFVQVCVWGKCGDVKYIICVGKLAPSCVPRPLLPAVMTPPPPLPLP